MIAYIAIFLISVFLSSVSQVLLKTSANAAHENKAKEYLNPRVIAAYALFFACTLITVLAYRKVPLSLGAILEASGYIFVAVLGRIFLKEKIGKRKLFGLVVVLVGILIFNMD